MYSSYPSHISTCHTHAQSLEHYRTSVITLILRSIASVSLVISCCEIVTKRVILCLLFRWSMVVMSSKYAKCVITVWVQHKSIFFITQPFSEIFLTRQLSFAGPRLSWHCTVSALNDVTLLTRTMQFQSSATFLDSQSYAAVPSSPAWTTHLALSVLKIFPCLLEFRSVESPTSLPSRTTWRCPPVSSLNYNSLSSRTAEFLLLGLSAAQCSLALKTA